MIKVDIIPISMALAQAAIESGWGTSRYLREGNAVYGQYTFEKKIKGFYLRREIVVKNFLLENLKTCLNQPNHILKI